MISPFGFTMKLVFLVFIGFLGFALGGCIFLWCCSWLTNWLYDKKVEMDAFRAEHKDPEIDYTIDLEEYKKIELDKYVD